MNTLALLVLLCQIEQVHIVIVAHVGRRDKLLTFAEAERGDGSASLGQSHHIDSLSCLRVPNEDHRFKTNLASCDLGPVSADAQSYDVVTMAKLTLGLLFAALDELLAAAENLLSPLFWVQNNS